MKLVETPFKEVDLAQVSEMILQARQSTGHWESSMKQDRVEEIMLRNFESLNVSVISAVEDSNIQGVILLKVNEDRTADINPWFLGGLPLISPKVSEADQLASTLLGHAIESAKTQGVTMIQAIFRQEMHTKSSKKLLEDYKMSIIEELENSNRSIYTGSLGYINIFGDMDLNILIRTLLVKDKKIYFHVGGGIVADSTPEGEYQETLVKARAIQDCLMSLHDERPTPSIR